MAANRFVEVTDKEISEIKTNSVPKTQKTCVKILKQLFASGSVIIGEYSPRLRLGEYSKTAVDGSWLGRLSRKNLRALKPS